MLIEIISKSS